MENLREMPAEEFALAIKGKPENLNCKTAFDLLFNANTRFQSINSFREVVFKVSADEREKLLNSPIMLLDPTKIISHLKFKYALDQCPKTMENSSTLQKKKYKEKNNMTTSQGKPIFSAFNIYRHYMSQAHWNRAS